MISLELSKGDVAMVLETKRLVLREMVQEDFPDLAEMLQDPEVMYAYEHSFSQEDVQAWLDRQKCGMKNMALAYGLLF